MPPSSRYNDIVENNNLISRMLRSIRDPFCHASVSGAQAKLFGYLQDTRPEAFISPAHERGALTAAHDARRAHCFGLHESDRAIRGQQTGFGLLYWLMNQYGFWERKSHTVG